MSQHTRIYQNSLFIPRRDTRKVADSSTPLGNKDQPYGDQSHQNATVSYGSTSLIYGAIETDRNASSPISVFGGPPEDASFDRTEQNLGKNTLQKQFTEKTDREVISPEGFDVESAKPDSNRPNIPPLVLERSLGINLQDPNLHEQASHVTDPLEMETIDGVSPRRQRLPRPSHRRRYSSDASVPKPSHHRRHSSSIPSFRQETDLEGLKKTLQLRERQLGPHSPKVAKIHNLIGNYHFRGREFELAEEAYQKAILCSRGAKAPVDYSPIAAAFGNLSTVYRSMRDGEKSSMCLERALNLHIYVARGQQKDPNTCLEVADCLYQVGLTQILRELYFKALDTLAHCRQMRENILGKNHTDVARAIDAMGNAYSGLEDYEKAMQCHQEALEMKKNSGSNLGSSGYLVSMKNIAEVHEARNAVGDAIGVYLKMNKLQINELARARMNQTQVDPGVTRLALETGEILLKLKELYSSTGNTVEGLAKGREAALYFREAGVQDDDTRMISCWVRGNGVWNSV